jgi:hypothetical protein
MRSISESAAQKGKKKHMGAVPLTLLPGLARSISSPSVWHEVVPEACRNQSIEPWWAQLPSARLRLHRRAQMYLMMRGPIRLLHGQPPIGGFCQMSRHGTDGFLMAFRADQALIEPADMAGRMTPTHPTAHVGGFDQGPPQAAVYIRPQWPIANLTAARTHTRRRPGIRGQIFWTFKTPAVADLQGDDHRRDNPPGSVLSRSISGVLWNTSRIRYSSRSICWPKVSSASNRPASV